MPRLTDAAGSGAGSTATLRFERGMRSWRAVIVKRARWAFILVGGAPIAIEIARADHHTIDWILGLTTGGTIALWLVLADSPPWYIERWRWGAEAERSVGSTLHDPGRQRFTWGCRTRRLVD